MNLPFKINVFATSYSSLLKLPNDKDDDYCDDDEYVDIGMMIAMKMMQMMMMKGKKGREKKRPPKNLQLLHDISSLSSL